MVSEHMGSDHTALDHMVRVAFASGLNLVAVVAETAGIVAGVLVLALVRARREPPAEDSRDLGREHMPVAETV
ncbi:hypothetical protein [Streptomyces violascens]|uniref:Uncharacterized protein n=1 Tax=Streptomyces violascens TaxID=67381 RepID=A0ABQ3QWU4_9ACTN|nr:hypothetical protein [Streptomyces violascens]GGU12050.1 hypothetical protein GCM10010289_36770 [Streptomyces violascens]GHI41728.1 hypothetical protein Sviol_61360 [Streptomyces violascens]